MNFFHLFVILLGMVFLMQCEGRKIPKSSLPFFDCGSEYQLLSISISGCSFAPCRLNLGRKVNVTAEFASYSYGARSVTETLRHEATWLLNLIYTKAYVTPEKCSGNLCPEKSVEGLVFNAELLISRDLPTLRGNLFWRLYNDRNDAVMCYKIPISIMP